MSSPFSLLESFDDRLPPESAETNSSSGGGTAGEQARLAAYEAGYQSGWDDCAAAEREGLKHVKAELARNLRDLAYTYHEARMHMMSALEPFLRELFESVLPSIVGKATVEVVIEEIVEAAGDVLDIPAEVTVAPSEAELFRSLLPDSLPMPVALRVEETLAEGQVYVRLGQAEKKIDLTRILARLTSALDATKELNRKEVLDVG